MNYSKSILLQSALFYGLFSLFSCTNEQAEVKQPSMDTKVVKQTSAPFPFYKELAVTPGFGFEVVSWGKGVDSLGGYLILMSDSLKNNYKSFAVEREGIISDAWNMDLDNDGNPEIYVELKSEGKKADLNVFEYSRGNFQKINFPGLPSKLKKLYGGDDKYFIKEGELFRSFPVVNPQDTTEKAGAIKVVRYSLRGNQFSTSELEVEITP
jgi:hypothetical protein